MKDRYHLVNLYHGRLLGDWYFDSLPRVREHLTSLKVRFPTLLQDTDLWVTDQKSDKEYSVDQSWKLVEM